MALSLRRVRRVRCGRSTDRRYRRVPRGAPTPIAHRCLRGAVVFPCRVGTSPEPHGERRVGMWRCGACIGRRPVYMCVCVPAGVCFCSRSPLWIDP